MPLPVDNEIENCSMTGFSDTTTQETSYTRPCGYLVLKLLTPVVQSVVSLNPGLKFEPLFSFLYFYTLVYLKTAETKTTINPRKM